MFNKTLIALDIKKFIFGHIPHSGFTRSDYPGISPLPANNSTVSREKRNFNPVIGRDWESWNRFAVAISFVRNCFAGATVMVSRKQVQRDIYKPCTDVFDIHLEYGRISRFYRRTKGRKISNKLPRFDTRVRFIFQKQIRLNYKRETSD